MANLTRLPFIRTAQPVRTRGSLLVLLALASAAPPACKPGEALPSFEVPGDAGRPDSGGPKPIKPPKGDAPYEPTPEPDAGYDAGDPPPQPDAGPEKPDYAGMVLPGPSRGAAVAMAHDDSLAVVLNRDAGSASVIAIEPKGGGARRAHLIGEVLLGEGSEPWQVAIGPDGDTAFVVLRAKQKLVRIANLHDYPELDGSVSVGSEPTSIALSPTGRYAYVANWTDGTVSEVDTEQLELRSTIDLNPALVATGYLGDIAPRPALAHPRSLVMSNDLDADDADETLYVTEYFGQQLEAELADGSNSDTRKAGIVYTVTLADRYVDTIALGPLFDIGFVDERGAAAGCYPNQLQSIAIAGHFAYVVSVCASPKGPVGVKTTTTACAAVEDCAALDLQEPVCALPFAGAPSPLCVDVASVKTTTAPVVSIIDLREGREIESGGINLNARFAALFAELELGNAAQRFPLFAIDIEFVPGSGVAYLTANGSDAVFRIKFDPETAQVLEVGGSTQPFIDLAPAGVAPDKAGKNPIGIAIGRVDTKLAIVANDVTRNASLLDFNMQALAGGAADASVVRTSALPEPGSDAARILAGKRLFNTGLGRWSLRGQGWGACQSCHADGLTDNVTWYFARGPRQSTSLDGSFASTHPEDQRIFNWTAILDEVDDFEANTRGVSGGVGAIVSALSTPPQTGDRIDVAGLGHGGLSGSAEQLSDPANPLGLAAPSVLEDWALITRYMQSLRSPRGPSNLDPEQVEAGRELFVYDGSCQGCHGGEKWTVSRRFYTPSVQTNAELNDAPLVIPAGFPAALLPAQEQANQKLRFAGGNAAAFDQILCAIRPVGTFDVAEPGVGIAELRADMSTKAQGDGNPAGEGRGYNVPSLLGLATGGPYLHAGQARTLEALFSDPFDTHYRALAPNFLTESDPEELERRKQALIAFLLSIDEGTAWPSIPEPGGAGGSLCPETF